MYESCTRRVDEGVQDSYIAIMLITLPDADRYYAVTQLRSMRDDARKSYFEHADPGGLTPPEKKAWDFEHFALQLILQAAQVRLEAEEEMTRLLAAERAA